MILPFVVSLAMWNLLRTREAAMIRSSSPSYSTTLDLIMLAELPLHLDKLRATNTIPTEIKSDLSERRTTTKPRNKLDAPDLDSTFGPWTGTRPQHKVEQLTSMNSGSASGVKLTDCLVDDCGGRRAVFNGWIMVVWTIG